MARTMQKIFAVPGFLNGLTRFFVDLPAVKYFAGWIPLLGCTDRGVAAVIAETPDLRLTAKTFDEHSQRTLDHELGISFFHVSLTEYCRTNGFELYWQQKGLKKKTVAPDAYFAITDPRLLAGKDTFHYFLEIERAKIGNVKNGEPSILRKLGRYYDYLDSDECQKEWECFRQFRVIIVQSNQRRQQYLLTELASSIPHRMFWLTTELLCKNNIGASIFFTPRDYAHRAYSFCGSRSRQI